MRWPGQLGLFLMLVTVPASSTIPARGDDAVTKPRPLTVCAIPGSLPRTGRAVDGAPRGLDIGVIEALGKRLGREVVYHWCASPDCAWHCLPAGRCDVVLGQPLGSGPPRGVAWSVPYAGAQFGLVVSRSGSSEGDAKTGAIRSLADLRGRTVGLVAGTVPLSETDHHVNRFPNREALLDGFKSTGSTPP